LIVGFAGKRYNHFFILRAEGTGNKFLRVVGIAILDLFRKSLLAFSANHVENGKFSLISRRASFTYRKILLAL